MNDSRYREPIGRNVARAVARSRSVRASAARRRRRLAALLACLGTAAAAPVAWFLAEPAAAVVASAASEARDLAEMLGQRSPGTRTQAELTKHSRVAAKARPKRKLAPHPTVPGTPETATLVDLLQPPVTPVALVAQGGPPPLAAPPTLGQIIASPPGGQSFTPPPGGGQPQTLPSPEPRELVPVPTAVPEPGTWAMMLLGFGLLAWRVRRRPADTAIRPTRLA